MHEFNILEFEGKVIQAIRDEAEILNTSGAYPQEDFQTPYVAVNTEEVGMIYDIGENDLKKYITIDISIWAESKIEAIEIREKIKKVLISKGCVCDLPSVLNYDLSSQKFFTDLSLEIVYNKLSGEYERRK